MPDQPWRAGRCKLPTREGGGYGLNRETLQKLADKGYKLIVTVDNGISAIEEADLAAELGIELVITDHHLPAQQLPKAVAVVDPKREDDTSPFKDLCGAGVAFKLCAALEGCEDPAELLEPFGELAALGTIADVMPLVGGEPHHCKRGPCHLAGYPAPRFAGPAGKRRQAMQAALSRRKPSAMGWHPA